MQITKVRMPFCSEWANAFMVVNGIEDKIHSSVGTLCQERDPAWPDRRMVGGADGKMSSENEHLRRNDIGFRPVFEVDTTDDLQEGDIVTVGTLFMDGYPVRVPTNPIVGGDTDLFTPGRVLGFSKQPIGKPAGYDVTAIKVGNVLVADRVLITNVSWTDIVENFGPCESVVSFRASRLVSMLADAHAERPTTPYMQGLHDGILYFVENVLKETT